MPTPLTGWAENPKPKEVKTDGELVAEAIHDCADDMAAFVRELDRFLKRVIITVVTAIFAPLFLLILFDVLFR